MFVNFDLFDIDLPMPPFEYYIILIQRQQDVVSLSVRGERDNYTDHILS
jgi:hypothetical protein